MADLFVQVFVVQGIFHMVILIKLSLLPDQGNIISKIYFDMNSLLLYVTFIVGPLG